MKQNRNENNTVDRENIGSDAVRNHRSREERVAENFENEQQSQKNEEQRSCAKTSGDHKNGWQSGDGCC